MEELPLKVGPLSRWVEAIRWQITRKPDGRESLLLWALTAAQALRTLKEGASLSGGLC